jgi:hypothetical protein
MTIRFLTFVLLLSVAACSSPPPPPKATPVAKPVVLPPAPIAAVPQQTADWVDWPLTPGDWVYRRDDRGSIALFGVPGADALVTLRCDTGRKRVYLARSNTSGSPSASFKLRASSSLKEFAAQTTGGPLPYLATEIMPGDPILDAITYTRGRIALEVTGQTGIAIPSWSEIARVVEDCRG